MNCGKDFEELLAKAAGLEVRSHSGKVAPGDVFCAISGGKTDGAAFIPDALARGAAWIVAAPGVSLPAGVAARLVTVAEPALALGELAAARYGTMAPGLDVIGVTGTNGKTTVAFMIEHLLNQCGRKAGLMGTVTVRWPGYAREAGMTTPDCLDIHEALHGMRQAGADVALMEVSSHALDQHRDAGVEYSAAVFTNLTQDHLDYHGDMETYFKAKERLFTECPRQDKTWIVSADDEYGLRLLDRGGQGRGLAIGYTLENAGGAGWEALRGEIVESSNHGMRLRLRYGDLDFTLATPLIGRHNAANLLAACAFGLSIGYGPEQLAVMERFAGAPGRLERVINPKGLHVFVDFAHTPDALDNVLSAVRKLGFGRLIVAFGCGGNRDRTKRPRMAASVARFADVAILTSDNPRDEDPLDIIREAEPGLAGCPKVITEPDRRKAIALGVAELGPDDVLIICGKGHENTQTIRGVKHHFSDVETAGEILRCA